jgi:hypothetical protein
MQKALQLVEQQFTFITRVHKEPKKQNTLGSNITRVDTNIDLTKNLLKKKNSVGTQKELKNHSTECVGREA